MAEMLNMDMELRQLFENNRQTIDSTKMNRIVLENPLQLKACLQWLLLLYERQHPAQTVEAVKIVRGALGKFETVDVMIKV